MPVLADRVRETTTTTGTGTLTLDGAQSGYQSFVAAFGTSASVYYVISGGTDWEVGIGTTGTGTLSRDTILRSSNAGAAVNWGAGTKDVFCAYVADRAVTTSDSATLTNKTISGASNTLSNIPNSATTATDVSTASAIASRDANGSSSFKNVKFDGTSSGTVTVQPAAAAGTWSLTLPTTAGTNGQVLSTNGSGVTSWATAGVFSDSAITPTLASPYDITTSDVNKRLLMNSTSQGAVRLLSSNTSGIAVGSSIRIASMEAGTALVTDGNLDQSTTLGAPNNSVRKTVQQSDGKLIIVGDFTALGGTTRNYIARLNSDGTLDTGYNPNANALVDSVALQSDGKAVIVGNFTTIGGTTRNYVARINTDGTLDTGFDPNANARTLAVAVQSSDQKILIGGNFTTIGGTAQTYLARLNTGGTLDTGYTANTNSTVRVIRIQSDGKAVIGGDFTTAVSTVRNRVARINTAGTLDTGFADPNVNGAVHDLAIQSDGKYVIVGAFTSVASTTRNRCARLNSGGTLDTGFNPNCNAQTQAVVIDTTGKIWIGGQFTGIGSVVVGRNRLARLNSDGSLDFTVNPNLNSEVLPGSLTATSDRLYVGGPFTTVGVLNYAYVVRLFIETVDVLTAPNPTAGSFSAGFSLINVPLYGAIQIEKMATGRWLITQSNAN